MDANSKKTVLYLNRREDAPESLAPPAELGDQPGEQGSGEVINFRNHAQRKTSDAFAAIVAELVVKAKEGSISHTRLLFEISGIKEQFAQLAKQKIAGGPGLGERLLEEANRMRDEAILIAVEALASLMPSPVAEASLDRETVRSAAEAGANEPK